MNQEKIVTSFREQLMQSLQLVAADADVQIAALPEFVSIPDEIALIFDHCYQFADQLLAAHLLTPAQQKNLNEIDALFSNMTDALDKKELWSIKGLMRDSRWATVRSQARATLASFGVLPAKPDVSWMKFVRS